MRRLYNKAELTFSLLWIGAYVILFSLADSISDSLGTAKLITAPLCICMSVFLLLWIRKNSLLDKYGLGPIKIAPGQYLYFLPLLLIVSTNLWGGIALRFSVPETALYIISMIGVGIIEEIIFRGFLFRALYKDSVNQAIAISSVTFGLGHIVNLFNGAEVVPTLLQLCYATTIGFLFTIIFHRSGSLFPCIVTHSMVNSLSVLGAERSAALDIAATAVLIATPLLYALWIQRKVQIST